MTVFEASIPHSVHSVVQNSLYIALPQFLSTVLLDRSTIPFDSGCKGVVLVFSVPSKAHISAARSSDSKLRA